jgi:hypothetical protein
MKPILNCKSRAEANRVGEWLTASRVPWTMIGESFHLGTTDTPLSVLQNAYPLLRVARLLLECQGGRPVPPSLLEDARRLVLACNP